MADVLKSFIKELPENDEFQVVAKEIPLIKKLIDTGYTGRKGKGGFYRMNKDGNKKILFHLLKVVLDILSDKTHLILLYLKPQLFFLLSLVLLNQNII